jgi:nickel-dependent lactate racemase
VTRTVHVNYGQSLLPTGLHEGRVAFDLQPAATPPVPHVSQEIRRALEEPVSSRPLRELVGAGKRVVIVGDDLTRLTPCDQIIPLLLDELYASGVPDNAITVVIALGTHRPMTEEEIVVKYGPRVTKRVQVVNHDCLDEQSLVACGITSRGTDIWVNRIVLEADVRIGVGNIVPHYPTGWSGGAKILLPGVAGERTTAQMHFLGATGHRLGEQVTPCREEMEDFAAAIGLDFIVNVVLNRHGELVRAVAGHFVAAHREGVEWAKTVYGVRFREQADVTLSSTYPIDFDFWQAKKGLFSATLCTKEGGEIILISPCHEGVSPTHPETVELARLNDDELWRLVEEDGPYDPLSICAALYRNDVKRHCRVTVASEGVSCETAQEMGFNHIEPAQLSDYLAHRLVAAPGLTVGILRNSAETLPMYQP